MKKILLLFIFVALFSACSDNEAIDIVKGEIINAPDGYYNPAFSFVLAKSGRYTYRMISGDKTHPAIFNTYNKHVRIIINLAETDPDTGVAAIFMTPHPFNPPLVPATTIKRWDSEKVGNEWVLNIDEVVDLTEYDKVLFIAGSPPSFTITRSELTFTPLDE